MIHILPPEEARKIAAGEVVDRPASLVRELLDNAIDAGGLNIEVVIEEGGIRRIEVIDDGCGMDKEDLELCYYDHATSKIYSLDDLNKSTTLGFRGEALSAAAAVSSLDILSSTDGREAWHLEAGPGESRQPVLERSRRVKGSSVRCFGLFDTIPARKRFLKRDFSEANLCYQAFVDKVLAFPNISFRFTQNNKIKTMLPAVSSLKERFAALMPNKNDASFLHEIKTSGDRFSISIIIGGGELARNDRRQQYIFVNGRRIQDFSLLQALEYGMQGVFPNGTHPVGAVFIDIAPELADFNIHPAKKEARFVDAGSLHHAITASLRNFSHYWRISKGSGAANGAVSGEGQGFAFEYKNAYESPSNPSNYHIQHGYNDKSETSTIAMEALLEGHHQFAPLPGKVAEETPPYGICRFAGRVFDLFIMVEKDAKLFIIDQHAAHERILYDKEKAGPILKQEI